MASTENGTTQFFGGLLAPLTKAGNINSDGDKTLSSIVISSTIGISDNNEYGATSGGGLQSLVPSSPSVSVNYYKMRGFYVLGSAYETWIVTNSPSLTPPSEHSLINVVIETFWQS